MDKQVQESLRCFFETFHRTGSATATVKAFRKQGLLFPRRLKKGPHKGDLLWVELLHNRALQVLHNPRYAGAFVYRRTRTHKTTDGKETSRMAPRDQWILLPGVHPGYISWEEYEANLRQLRQNAQSQGQDRRKSPPREGPALLQGLVLCGACGKRMTVRYHNRDTRRVPDYVCQKDGIEHGQPVCQSIKGEPIDKTISDLLLQTMTPMALDVALTVQQEIHTRLDEVDHLRHKQVERARYEADLAQRRYMHVDPANRLVADALEAEWNNKLRSLNETQEQYERMRHQDHLRIDDAQRTRIAALANDFPRLWQQPQTPDRERKRMVRLLLEDVTLIKRDEITVHVRFKGGVVKTLTLPLPLSAPELRKTDEAVIQIIDRLLDHHTDGEIAAILNQKGMLSGEGKSFHRGIILHLRDAYHLKDRFTRMRAVGMLTKQEIAALMGISVASVKEWRLRGLLRAHRYNDKGDCLFEAPAQDLPRKNARKRPYLQKKQLTTIAANEVQYET